MSQYDVEALKKQRTVEMAEKDQMIANLNAKLGRIQMLDNLIAQAETPAQAEPSKQPFHIPGKGRRARR